MRITVLRIRTYCVFVRVCCVKNVLRCVGQIGNINLLMITDTVAVQVSWGLEPYSDTLIL